MKKQLFNALLFCLLAMPAMSIRADVIDEGQTTEGKDFWVTFMQADQDEWTKVVEWASSMKQAFLNENAGLTPFNWGGTVLEAYLAKTVYDKEAVYTLSTLEFAQDGALEPNDKVDALKYFEMLTKDATYEVVDDEAPDGEYVVLNFPEEDVRFDFFYAQDGKNLIRQVWGDNEQVYKVTFADETKTANDIMDAWARELAENR